MVHTLHEIVWAKVVQRLLVRTRVEPETSITVSIHPTCTHTLPQRRETAWQTYVLAGRLRSAQGGLGRGLGLLLARCLLALLLLLLVRERGEAARDLAHLDVAEGHRERADVVLEERGVERLLHVPLDDRLDDPVRELDEVVLCARLRRDQPVELLRGRACVRPCKS